MIYIVGHSFKINNSKIQNFTVGDVYKIARISPIISDENKKIQYTFSNLSNPTQPDIFVSFKSASEGDEYVAAVSGKRKELEAERNLIKTIIEKDEV